MRNALPLKLKSPWNQCVTSLWSLLTFFLCVWFQKLNYDAMKSRSFVLISLSLYSHFFGLVSLCCSDCEFYWSVLTFTDSIFSHLHSSTVLSSFSKFSHTFNIWFISMLSSIDCFFFISFVFFLVPRRTSDFTVYLEC